MGQNRTGLLTVLIKIIVNIPRWKNIKLKKILAEIYVSMLFRYQVTVKAVKLFTQLSRLTFELDITPNIRNQIPVPNYIIRRISPSQKLS